MKNAMNILGELFYNVDTENREITKPLNAEYNLKVKKIAFRNTSSLWD